MKGNEDESMKKFNDNIKQLDDELGVAITNYIKRGHCNLALVVGMLDTKKHEVREFSKRNTELDPNEFVKETPSYFG